MIQRSLAHYRITAAIGAGGMGEVYRATDAKLGREVALKVLPADMASDPERLERFRREARALAALDHPGIVTVHSVEEADGVHFLTMQLVEGQPLHRLIPEGGLPLDRIVEIADAIAEALVAAHDKGIVHRDLKPANVMLTKDGRIKVLDFGLAKVEGAAYAAQADSRLSTEMRTRDGVLLGTLPYMSPEQLQGGPLDHRTDLFALGVLLYELAAGQRPFQAGSSAELATAILRDTPRPLGELRADLPQQLALVIQRCLEKKAEDRPPSARDLREALRAVPRHAAPVQAAAAAPSRPPPAAESGALPAAAGVWIAVLPFKHRSIDADLEILAEGLSEEIAAGLARFSYLRVIARSSTSRYGQGVIDVRSVGQELGARYLMEGGLRQAGSALRISIQLLDAGSGTHLWAENYDRATGVGDVFSIQDEITDRVMAVVADPYGVLLSSMATPTGMKRPETLTPYEAVLRFFLYLQRVSPADHMAARLALERAVESEPGYADAWAGLARCVLDEYRHEFNPRPNSLSRALDAAQRAVDADRANSFANGALAEVHYFRGELGAARSSGEYAVSLNTRDTFTMAWAGILIAYGGDWERGLQLSARAMALNPHHPGWYRFPSFFDAYRRRRYAEAVAIAQQFNMPEYFAAHFTAAIAQAQLGNLAAAREEAEKTRQLLLGFEPEFLEGNLRKWIPGQPELVAHIIEGLGLAGLRADGPA